ncbi:MAG: TRAP transporter large permease subunit [Zetaproteobacteria bacterium]|nr:MAG: TRAP transporter large permease subunit [Zetaproteobacteria bacterium]
MFLNIIALLVTVATFTAIIRKAEVRLALLAGGLVMAVLSWNLQAFSEAFTRSMTTAGLISVILPVMGFAAVMELTGCNGHLVKMLTDPLLKVRMVLVPGAMLVTYLINTAISSAAGCTAAVGVILIPAMMAAGIHPAMAGAAVFAGTWGSVFSPGSPHPAMIAKIANVSVIDVILAHKTASIVAALVVAAVLFAEAKLFKQDKDWTPEKAGADLGKLAAAKRPAIDKVNFAMAIIPVVPLALLLLTVPQFGITTKFLPKGLTVLESMLIGSVLGMLVTWTSPTKVVTEFFDGMGRAYSLVIGIIIAAGVFIGGLEAAGVIKAFLEVLKEAKSAVPLLGTFGPFVVAVLSGSGDAAAIAFNTAVTPHAAQFGITSINLGNMAWVGGSLGRSMSPVAAACIIGAGFAGVSPFELAKRNAVPMLLAAVVFMLMVG